MFDSLSEPVSLNKNKSIETESRRFAFAKFSQKRYEARISRFNDIVNGKYGLDAFMV